MSFWKINLLLALLALGATDALAQQDYAKLLTTAQLREQEGNFDEANTAYERVRKEATELFEKRSATLAIGRVLRRRHKFQEAIDVLSPLVPLWGKDPVPVTPLLNHTVAMELSTCYLALRDYKTALLWASAARDKFPHGDRDENSARSRDNPVQVRMAQLLLKLDRLDEALAIVEPSLAPGGYKGYDPQLGLVALKVYQRRGQEAELIKRLRKQQQEHDELYAKNASLPGNQRVRLPGRNSVADVVNNHVSDVESWQKMSPYPLWWQFQQRLQRHLIPVSLHEPRLQHYWYFQLDIDYQLAQQKTMEPIWRVMEKREFSHGQLWAYVLLIEAGKPPKYEEVEKVLMATTKSPSRLDPHTLFFLQVDYLFLLTQLDFARGEKLLRDAVEDVDHPLQDKAIHLLKLLGNAP